MYELTMALPEGLSQITPEPNCLYAGKSTIDAVGCSGLGKRESEADICLCYTSFSRILACRTSSLSSTMFYPRL